MLVSRRKTKEPKAIKVYLNNEILEHVTTMKYLGIIIDHKFKFKQNITYVAERCTKLIHNLSRSDKLTWGIKHEALKTIYEGAILPLLLYGAPVWIDAMKYEHNIQKYIRVRLINIRMAKAFRTTSSEALCTLKGITPIIIRTEEVVKHYSIRKSIESQTQELDNVVEHKDWPHPAETKDYKDQTVQLYTDGSNCKKGVECVAVIFIGKEIVAQTTKLRI
jgi:hypothetical protein